MVGEMQISSVTFNVTILGINNDVAGKMPVAIFKIQSGRAALIGLHADVVTTARFSR